jgi:hypothetical protein
VKDEKAEKNGNVGYVEVARVSAPVNGVESSSEIPVLLDNGAI